MLLQGDSGQFGDVKSTAIVIVMVHAVGHREVRLEQAVLQRCVVHLFVEVGQAKFHSIVQEGLSRQLALPNLVKTGRQLGIGGVRDVTFVRPVDVSGIQGLFGGLIVATTIHNEELSAGIVVRCVEEVKQASMLSNGAGRV